MVFAHKTTDGWEALLSGMIRGGWTITGSWPIATERPAVYVRRTPPPSPRAFISSVVPVPRTLPSATGPTCCENCPSTSPTGWRAYKTKTFTAPIWCYACIGPALEIFSRYRAVETAEGQAVGLDAYLEKVWEVVGRAALQQVLGAAEVQASNGLTGALEEDARLTALFLWTRQSTDDRRRRQPARRSGRP